MPDRADGERGYSAGEPCEADGQHQPAEGTIPTAIREPHRAQRHHRYSEGEGQQCADDDQVDASLYLATMRGAGAQTVVTQVTGGGQPHENRQPFLVLNYIIATRGVYPMRD